MNGLVQFMRDRLNDDETFMRAAIRLRESGAIVSSPDATEGAFALVEVVQNDPDTAQALTLFTHTGCRAPGEAERVLEEVDSKRRVVEEYANYQPHDPGYAELELVVQLLALPYSGHVAYKDRWRP
jgi:hypothetical protein